MTNNSTQKIIEKYQNYFFNDYHIFNINGFEIIYNVQTTFYDRLTPIIKSFLKNNHTIAEKIQKLIKHHTLIEIEEAMRWLVKHEFLIDKKKDNNKHFKINPYIHTIVMNISHDCNIGCPYCYASKGKYGGEKGYMSLETAKKTVDFLLENSVNKKNLSLFFFGGEPLLNFDLIVELLPYIKQQEKKYNKTIFLGFTTNATILTKDIVDFCNKNKINIHISIDGPEEIHDKNRYFLNGEGTYKIIENNLKYLLRTRPKSVTSRATFTHDNINILKSVKHIIDMGFKSVFIGPAEGSWESCITEDDIEEIKRQYNELVEFYLDKVKKGEKAPINPLDTKVKLMSNKNKNLKFFGCGAGRGYIVVTKEGDIYPCKKCIEHKLYKMGNISSGIKEDMLSFFYENTVCNPKKDCNNCWLKFTCGGYCIMMPIDYGEKDIYKSKTMSCEIVKHIYKLAMMINIQLKESKIKSEDFHFNLDSFLDEDLTNLNELKLMEKIKPLYSTPSNQNAQSYSC